MFFYSEDSFFYRRTILSYAYSDCDLSSVNTSQLLTRNRQTPCQNFSKCSTTSFSLHTSIRNMYRSFASLGVVNDLTCLIIIYYVFWAEKISSSSRAGRMFKDPARDPILSICQMCCFSIPAKT